MSRIVFFMRYASDFSDLRKRKNKGRSLCKERPLFLHEIKLSQRA